MGLFRKKDKSIKVDVNIDYEKLAEAIVKAQEENSKTGENRKEQLHQSIIEKRIEVLHEKNFSHIKCKFIRRIRTFFNQIRVFLGLMFISKKDAQHFAGISMLTKMVSLALLALIRYGLYFLCIRNLLFMFIYWNDGKGSIHLLCALVFFIIARFIRIAKFEVEAMQDENCLNNTAMAIIAFVALLASIIGVIVGLR